MQSEENNFMNRNQGAILGGIDEGKVREVVRKYLASFSFTDRKVTDTPTDALMVVNRKYVNLNGATASRPTSSITGQFYFDTTLGQPVWWSGSTWVDSSGNPT